MSRWLPILVGCLLIPVALATADDLGEKLNKAAERLFEGQAAPDNVERTIAPFTLDAEPHTVQTADGWMLVVHRYRSHGRPQPSMPIILCHGFGYNALFWDLEPACSFAEYLARRGYDVWSVNLRGCGLSQKWVWELGSAPTEIAGSALRKLSHGKLAPTGYATLDPKYANWNMDDHIAFDVPAVISLVRQHTGANQVAWIGHSMGGIIALGCLERYPNPGIGKLITVGSQVTMPQGQLLSQFAVEMIKMRERQFAGMFDKHEKLHAAQTSLQNIFFNERHVSPSVYHALCSWASDVPSIGLVQQYAVLSNGGELLDHKRQYHYAHQLANVKVPVLVSCGEADQIAPPEVQRYLYEHLGSHDKTLMVFGRAAGFAADAGHDDTLVGLTSSAQVFPVLERWLRTGKP
jgi:pimeloyl-ACP methyl ester carboxylesterase